MSLELGKFPPCQVCKLEMYLNKETDDAWTFVCERHEPAAIHVFSKPQTRARGRLQAQVARRAQTQYQRRLLESQRKTYFIPSSSTPGDPS